MRILTLILSLLLSASTAQATPPQIVWVSETLLGMNDTHIFVLRRMDDNMGLHHPTQTDVVLIARNRKTNLDTQIWPVMRMIDHGFHFTDYGYETRVESLPLKGRVNPFDILLEHQALPLLGEYGATADNIRAKVLVGADALTIINDHDTTPPPKDAVKAVYRIAHADIAARITASLNATRKTLPAYFIEGGDRGVDSLLDAQINPGQDCEFGDFVAFYEVVEDEFTKFWLTRATCENEETLVFVSMNFLVQKMP